MKTLENKKEIIKTVIFDMDGVIVDTEPIHHDAFQKQFSELNIHITDEVYAALTGLSTQNIFQKLKETFGIKQDVEDLVQRKRAIFNEAFDAKKDLCLLDGVEDLIKDLYANGMQLIVASSASKETIERVFTRFNLYQYFTDIVSGEDFPQSKPNPAIFLYAASLSEAPVENCIIIEDSTNGVIAAKRAGIFCVGYNSEHSKMQDLSEANMIINHFDELNFEKIVKIKSFIR